ncbi:carboxymuconolactone decarboxylase family protein [Kitasatospora sp. NPDC059463]|uniref:carboxymuconolactone decarboxylase family protein n=1 Tax=unclassified Kitasatospora TaxID=2633591 RepID=UPI0036B7CEF1
MPRIPQLTPDTAGGEQRELLEATRRQLGRVPNLYAALANSPAALRGYLALRESLGGGALDERLREQLALLVAQENDCLYCVSAHTLRGGRLLGMTDDELLATRSAEDADPHTRAVLRTAAELVRNRGHLTEESLAKARAAGVTDAEFAEIVSHVALNTLSNYFNHLAEPDLDFPPVDSLDVPTAGPAVGR